MSTSDRRLLRLLPVTLAALAAAALAFGLLGADAPAPAVAKDGKVYDVVLPSPTVKAGEKAGAPVAIKAHKGWKWNTEYPARVSVSVTGPVKASPEALSGTKGEIQLKGKDAAFPLQVEGSAKGKGEVLVKANFSICSEDACRIFRNEEFRFPVTVE